MFSTSDVRGGSAEENMDCPFLGGSKASAPVIAEKGLPGVPGEIKISVGILLDRTGEAYVFFLT